MPPRPQALPRLLRDDALAHLKREYKGTVTLQSDHPLKGSSLGGSYRLHLPGAALLAIQIDARSELSGTARLRFCADEAGLHEVARFDGIALGRWQNVTAAGDTLWVLAAGETARHSTRGGPTLRPARAPPCSRIRPTPHIPLRPTLRHAAPHPCDPRRPTPPCLRAVQARQGGGEAVGLPCAHDGGGVDAARAGGADARHTAAHRLATARAAVSATLLSTRVAATSVLSTQYTVAATGADVSATLQLSGR